MGEFHYAIRRLFRAPAFFTASVLLIAIGVGANAIVSAQAQGFKTIHLEVHSHRPMPDNIDALSKAYGVQINFEEPAYVFEGDLARSSG
jgi:hypothetical protein